MMKLTVLVTISIAILGTMLTSCNKIDDMEGMNDGRSFYSYRAYSKNFDYQDAPGPFDTAIRSSVGLDPIVGGADDKVVEACNACYENLKQQLRGRHGTVLIYKTRHPDGKQKILKEYKF